MLSSSQLPSLVCCEHRVEKRESLLLQVPQHVPGYGRKLRAHQDMQAERRQRSTIERLGARHRLLQRFLRCFMPGKHAQPHTLHRGTCRLRREQKTHAFVAGPRRRIERLPTWTGSDILNRHATAGLEHAPHLAIEPRAIRNVHCRILRPHEIEARIGKRQLQRIPLPVADFVGEPRAFGEHARELDELRSKIEADDLAAECTRDVARWPTDAAADIEDFVAAAHCRKPGQADRCVALPIVEFVDWSKIVRGQMLEVFSCCLQGRQNGVAESAARVVFGNCLRRARHARIPCCFEPHTIAVEVPVMARGFRIITAALITVFALLSLPAVYAQDYPTRPVTIIVPTGPGGGTDIIARLIGAQLAQQLGQAFVIDNRPGAGLLVGTTAAAKAEPDGYALLLGLNGSMAVNPSLFSKLPYDPIRDFTPVAMLADYPFVVVVNKELPVRSIADLIELAKSKPGELNYGSA